MARQDRPGRKVAVVGAGMVGSSFAYALIINGVARRLALIDRDPDRAAGEAMDLAHSLSFLQPVVVESGGYELCGDADIVVITAGAAQKPGESRLDLTRKNAAIIKKIVPLILTHNPDPIILMVTNPVDILTQVLLQESGLERSRVIGSGTMLDSSRFRHLLSQNCGVDVRNVHAYVVGEHGDSEVLVWSHANLAGAPLSEMCPVCTASCMLGVKQNIDEQVRNAAYKIIRRKSSTNWAIGLAVTRIVETILMDQDSVLTVSALWEGAHGLPSVCFSWPRLVGWQGVKSDLAFPLDPGELEALNASAEVIRDSLEALGS
ncbi:MAG: L-lactate dehydrogenase [Deltaproteobacteria bacterium]|nr:L-lactate dehydrogenase [Deltaproteobacteria bacterium]